MTALARTLGVPYSTAIGVAAMLGAGVFFVWAPAFEYAGSWLWVSLAIAAAIATLNAMVTTQLAINHPQSGGIYAFGRHYRGPFTGFVAGWMFLTGKTASVAAIALIAAHYLAPSGPRWWAAGIVVVGTVVTAVGIRPTAAVSFTIAVVVAVGLVTVVGVSVSDPQPLMSPERIAEPGSMLGVMTAAGLIFFAFAGYARMATLAEEVRNPRTTLPWAIGLALAIVLAIYALVAWAVFRVLPGYSGEFDTPLRALVTEPLSPFLTVLAVIACMGSLLAIVAGLSRTALHMARHGDIPTWIEKVSTRTGSPVRATLVVGAAATLAVIVLDTTSLVAVSGAGVLTYYAIGHWSALAQPRPERFLPSVVPIVGLLVCVALVATLPWVSVLVAVVSLLVGGVWFAVARAIRKDTKL